jgi:spermidine/putrescine-binding protein
MREIELITRRRLLRRSGQLAALATLPGLLSACGSDDDEGGDGAAGGQADATATPAPEIAGTITMMNYPDWIGDKEVQLFEEKYPEAKVKQVTGLTSGAAQAVAQINQNRDSYDMSLAGLVIGGQLDAAKLLAPVNPDLVPNLANIPSVVRDAYPFGMPVDLGKTGFAYRKDLISETPQSWADLWELAPNYSGKITMLKYDVDIMGAALIYKGFSVNATEESELEAAKEALLEIKPHLRAFLPTDFAKPLIQGTAVIAVDYDYDIALAQEKNENIVWVSPEEGTPAYLDGWVALKDSDNLATVYAFMDHHLEPEVYGNYINTIGAAYVHPDAEPHINESIKANPSLKYDPEQIASVDFEKFIGAEASARRAKIWEQVLAA